MGLFNSSKKSESQETPADIVGEIVSGGSITGAHYKRLAKVSRDSDYERCAYILQNAIDDGTVKID